MLIIWKENNCLAPFAFTILTTIQYYTFKAFDGVLIANKFYLKWN